MINIEFDGPSYYNLVEFRPEDRSIVLHGIYTSQHKAQEHLDALIQDPDYEDSEFFWRSTPFHPYQQPHYGPVSTMMIQDGVIVHSAQHNLVYDLSLAKSYVVAPTEDENFMLVMVYGDWDDAYQFLDEQGVNYGAG